MQEDAQKVYSAYDIYIVNRREVFLFFKQKTAYEVRISGWSSDVCSSDLNALTARRPELINRVGNRWVAIAHAQYHPHIQVLLLKVFLYTLRLQPTPHQQGRALLKPYFPIAWSKGCRAAGQNENSQNDLPQPLGNFDDTRIGQELAQIPAYGADRKSTR